MNFHKLLTRQLTNSHLSDRELPTLEEWQSFLKNVNRFYNETDEERYLLERSMELSSREMLALNESLEHAQHIAELGYWYFNTTTGVIIWSKELRRIFGISETAAAPKYEEIMSLIHPNYRQRLETLVDRARIFGEQYEIELPFRKANDNSNEYKWLYAIGAPYKKGTAPYIELSGIVMDITRRKQAEDKLLELNRQIVDTARQIGMADVAISVLHNVGNVLNSVNVSNNLLTESLKAAHFDKLFAVTNLLQEHREHLSDYLLTDDRGKLIPEYLIALGASLQAAFSNIRTEIINLDDKIQRIRDIVMSQQTLTRVTVANEKVNLIDTIRSTVTMSCGQLAESGISLLEDFQNNTQEIYIDRIKLVQIIANLLLNAKEALIGNSNILNKQIIIATKVSASNETVMITIKDNGAGISEENLNKIFAYGFSTKQYGHGIGLYSSMITAKALGGKISVHSTGLGGGAEFTLELPLHSSDENLK